MKRSLPRFALGLFASLSLSAAGPAPFNTELNTNGPLPVVETLARTVLPAGFRLSLVAAEPEVQQPIGIATDARGQLWVAENYTYSEAKVGYHPELKDRILVLSDPDGDGRYDQRRVFWDDAQRLTSVEVGLGGVWALALPHLVFIPDANGDGVADGPPQVMLDGFEYQSGRHTVANGLRWGPDGWLYGRHGIQSTSRLGPPGTPATDRVAMNVGVWRYHPGRRVVEVVAQGTTNPWGLDWDARGEAYFINTVIGHLWHVIPGAHYRRMYGEDPTPRIYEPLEQHADHVHWATGEVWTDVRQGVTDVTLAAGGGHAHTGLLIYQGGQWPAAWNDRLLTINYHGRRLNVERLDPQGTGIVGRREPDAFLFADPWFRGIDLLAAPDGGVFVSDWSDSGECHDQEGIHRLSGRIYHLGYGPTQKGPGLDLTQVPVMELVSRQTSANDWESRQSRRVLADLARRGEALGAAREALVRLTKESKSEVHRLRALWALQVTGVVAEDVLRAKRQGTPAERSWALRLQEDASAATPAGREAFARFAETELPAFAAAEDAAPVRLTLASLLQKLPVLQRAPLARALLQHGEDAEDHNQPLMLWYALEPLAGRDERLVELLASARIPRVQRLGARRLAEEYDAAPQRVDALLTAFAAMPSGPRRLALLEGLAQGFAGRRKVIPPSVWTTVQPRLAEGADADIRRRLSELGVLFGDAGALAEVRNTALSGTAGLPQRRAALESLIEARAGGLREVCEALLSVRDLAGTAAKGLSLTDDPAVGGRLLEEWPRLAGSDKPAVLNALLSRPGWAGQLLEAMAAGRVQRPELGVAQARQLRAFKQGALDRRLEEVWGTVQDLDESARQKALVRWRQKLTPAVVQRANRAEGQKLFAASCGTCHQLYGAGGNLGPDLTGSGRQNLDYLLENILFPSAVVPADFRQTTLMLKDGRALTGVVRSRTPQAVILAQVGEVATVSRADLEWEEVSPQSMMPEGLLDALSEAQAVDLVGYLMSMSPPR